MAAKLSEALCWHVAWLNLLAFLVLIAPGVYAQQHGLENAQKMLQELDRARVEAGKKGEGAKFTFDYMDRRLSVIETVLNNRLVSILAKPPLPSCGALQNELRRALGYRGEPDPNAASVLCPQTGRARYYVVAYALEGAVTYSRSWVGVLGPPAGASDYRLLAGVENSLPSKSVALAELPSGSGGTLNFLAYGINWGDAHNRLTVIAYSFDGQKLKSIWSRADLPQGRVKVDDGKIELSYLNSPLGPGYKSVHEVKETYRLTPAGITPETSLPSGRKSPGHRSEGLGTGSR